MEESPAIRIIILLTAPVLSAKLTGMEARLLSMEDARSHEIPDTAERERLRARWREALEVLRD